MRDSLPAEARLRGALAARVERSFALHGCHRVVVPAFERTAVLERGLGSLDPDEALRFVEPGTGAVVALRPDLKPQIARLVVTHLRDEPGPVHLAYHGSVWRRPTCRTRVNLPPLARALSIATVVPRNVDALPWALRAGNGPRLGGRPRTPTAHPTGFAVRGPEPWGPAPASTGSRSRRHDRGAARLEMIDGAPCGASPLARYLVAAGFAAARRGFLARAGGRAAAATRGQNRSDWQSG
ncbi:MAG: ATP phosphoribosyltransferase regulatory subunit [Polyangiaceae bacterium]|nr:ATP phosphoribosyltransferase regulatory subunit [Polyangiaceae bacterium]